MSKLKIAHMPILTPRKEAFDYQRVAVDAVKDLDYAAIFHEQGLGKTKIAIDLILHWFAREVVDTVIIVTKNGLVANWLLELKEHCHIKPHLLTNDPRKNYYVFNESYRLILSSYESIVKEKDRVGLFSQTRDVGIVLDESAKIKNIDSTVSKAFFSISNFFKRRVIMTGTPVANRPYDIWAQIYFLDQGEHLGSDFATFKRKLNLDNKLSKDKSRQVGLLEDLGSIWDKLRTFTIRETKKSGVISLPDKEYKNIFTSWEGRQYDIYSQIQKEMATVITKGGKPIEDISESVLKRLTRLIQVASNPRLIDESYDNDPGKAVYLYEIVSQIITEDKCIVWTSYVENVNWLARYLDQFGVVKVHGKMTLFDRARNIELFKNDVSKRVFIATPASAKEGLTLTVANHVVFYDRSFSLDDYLQAQDRIHRISQGKQCYIYNLIMKDSIDLWVDELINAKWLSAQLAQGDISSDDYVNRISYSYGDILRAILNIGGNDGE